MSITRRLFMSSSAGAMAIALPAAAEMEMTAREKAIWHIRGLERLAREDGAGSVHVMVVGAYGGQAFNRLFGLHHEGFLMDKDGMFAAKGGGA